MVSLPAPDDAAATAVQATDRPDGSSDTLPSAQGLLWPSAEAWTSFLEGPMTEGMKAAGMALPDDVEVTEVLSADAG